MADIMQFVRELLEDKPSNIGVRGIVTHVIKMQMPDPKDPAVYMYQIEVNGYLYCDVACTREPELQDMQVGDEVLSHRPTPEAEGFPIFLLLTKAPEKTEVGTSQGVGWEADKKMWENKDVAPFDPSAKDEERSERLADGGESV
ncbi:MAG: hypothetical protein PHH13_05685 [Candidatus Peribacteraceae bacterium]|nr:hypothetical protein [Candidatus Peribacteraceae bacterium]